MAGMECFTQRARRVLSLAHQEAERMRHNYIGTEHLLLGLMREDGGIAGQVFRDLGLEIERVQTVIERMTGLGQYSSSRPELSPGTQKVLELAVEEARKLGAYDYLRKPVDINDLMKIIRQAGDTHRSAE